jgi:hypothetical protein
MPFSDRPWGDFSGADYDLAQWHHACLIHLHQGPPTSKDQCKLPVREPSGTLNRNGIHAAAGALAGSRGGVDAPSAQKEAAARKIAGYYREMGEELPASVASIAHAQVNASIRKAAGK